jgi:hypothetical protein
MLTNNKYNTQIGAFHPGKGNREYWSRGSADDICGGILINLWGSHLVEVVGEVGHFDLETLSLSDAEDEVPSLFVSEGKSLDRIPMVEDALGEGLALGVAAQHAGEAEGLGDGQESLDLS